MTRQEVLDYIASKLGGDAGGALYDTHDEEVDIPLSPGDAAKRKATGQSLKTTVKVETWKTPGGQVIFEGYRTPGGNDEFTPTAQNSPKAERPPGGAGDTASNSPADRAKDAQDQRERDINGATPDAQGRSFYETNKEKNDRLVKEAATARQATLDQEARDRATATAAETARHNRVSEGQTASSQAASAREVVTAQDGSKWVWDRQTNQMTPAPGSNPTLPAGIGQFQPDPSKPGYGLFERRQALLDLVAKGTITEAQVKEILAQDSAMTKSLADQATAVTNGANTAYDNLMTQRGQDIGQANARLTSSNTQYSNALSFANQNAVGLARAGTTDIMGPLLRGQTLHAQRNGGLETPDAVALPKALSRYLTMDLPGMGKWAPVSQGVTDQGAAPQGSQPDWGNVPYQTAPDQPADPTAAPAGPQPPMRDDYSTTTDPSGGGVQAIDSMHPNQQLYQHLTSGDTDPEFAAAVAQHLGVTA